MALKTDDVTHKDENLKNIEAFYILQQKYIDGTIKAIEENYGSTEKYLNELGKSEKEIEEIRRILL